MKTYQIIFQGGRVQNLMADRYLHENGAVRFRTGRTMIEFPACDLIMIDQLDEDGLAQPSGTNMPRGFVAALD